MRYLDLLEPRGVEAVVKRFSWVLDFWHYLKMERDHRRRLLTDLLTERK